MKAIEMGKKCDSCANRNCRMEAKAGKFGVEMRMKFPDVICAGFDAVKEGSFSLLEMASGNSMNEVAELLSRAKLQFIPSKANRGFHLA